MEVVVAVAAESRGGGVAVLYNTNVLGKLIYLWVILRLISNYLKSWSWVGRWHFERLFIVFRLPRHNPTLLLLLLLPWTASAY